VLWSSERKYVFEILSWIRREENNLIQSGLEIGRNKEPGNNQTRNAPEETT
jgi:hypothetical protein